MFSRSFSLLGITIILLNTLLSSWAATQNIVCVPLQNKQFPRRKEAHTGKNHCANEHLDPFAWKIRLGKENKAMILKSFHQEHQGTFKGRLHVEQSCSSWSVYICDTKHLEIAFLRLSQLRAQRYVESDHLQM